MEILKLTNRLDEVADKLEKNETLSPGDRNIAKNLLREYSATLIKKSKKSSAVEKSTDAAAVKHREKVLRYRTKKRLEELTENAD